MYTISGITVATAATDAHCILEVWNPHSTRPVTVKEIMFLATTAPAAGAGFVTRRSTAKGTAGSTITPTIEHHTERLAAPDTAFTLEIAAFSAQPTLAAGELGPAWLFPATIASGALIPVVTPVGIRIPGGQGLCFVNRAAVIFPVSEFTIVVTENLHLGG